jgi:predicted MFS family arabinose efflux permease
MSLMYLVAWATASLFYAYQYVLRVMPNIMMVDIVDQFNIDAAAFGQLSGVYYIGYSLMHIPIGTMLDRYGAKKVVPVALLVMVAGLLPFIFSTFWLYPIIGRFFMGAGSSAAILSVFNIVRLSFSEKKFARMLSISVTIGLIGAIYGGGPVKALCDVFGYKMVLIACALGGIILALVSYLAIPETTKTAHRPVLVDMMEVFSNTKVLAVCFLAGLMVGPLEGFADVWGTEFLKRVYGFDTSFAASAPSLIFVGMCFGAPLLSLIAEKTDYYFGTIIVSGVIMAASFFALVGGYATMMSINISFICVGICCAYQILAIYKASTYAKPSVAGLTTAVANMIIMTFGYLFHAVIGAVINNMGGIENARAFTYGIAVIPLALTIGTAGFMVYAIVQNMKYTKIR